MAANGKKGVLVAYVTSHGFGHLNRSVSVLNHVPDDVPLVIRSDPSLVPHWRERLTRPADFEEHVSDAGAVNPPGNSADTDPVASIDRAAAVHADAVGRLDAEADRIREAGASAVLCDIPPLPLVAASRAKVPGFLLANFTWADIYRPYVREGNRGDRELVSELRRAYRHATAVFRASPALPMRWLPGQVGVGLVCKTGKRRGDELRQTLGLGPSTKLAYMYLGRYGQYGMGWDRLAELEREGLHFVGFHPAPVKVGNLHVVPAEEWTGADLAASCDVMVTKAGYGTVSEAIASGTPMVYPARTNFAEYRALAEGLELWGGGVRIPRGAFDRLAVGRYVKRALELRPGPSPYPVDGAKTVAAALTRVCRGSAVDEALLAG